MLSRHKKQVSEACEDAALGERIIGSGLVGLGKVKTQLLINPNLAEHPYQFCPSQTKRTLYI